MDLEASLITLKALADRSRLLILNTLLAGPLCAEEVAAALDLAPSTVSFHLKKLVEAGLVTTRRDQYYTIYSLAPDLLATSLRDLIGVENSEASAQDLRKARDKQKVLATFLSDGRLIKMPAQKRKRTIVLEHFAGLFEPGHAYGEPEVNGIIEARFADYCLVRRLLVDERFFLRDGGVYTRTAKPASPAQEDAPSQTHTEGVIVEARKKALKREYLQRGKPAGIFRITNRATGRSLLGSGLDVAAALNRSEFELRLGNHTNAALQADFASLGREGFDFEIVEGIEDAGDRQKLEAELERLERRYEPVLGPTTSYNEPGSFRVPPRRKQRASGPTAES